MYVYIYIHTHMPPSYTHAERYDLRPIDTSAFARHSAHIYIYIYIYIYVYIYVYMSTDTLMVLMYLYTYMFILYVCTHNSHTTAGRHDMRPIDTSALACNFAHIPYRCAHVYVYICLCVCVYIHVCACVYTNTSINVDRYKRTRILFCTHPV